MDRWPTVSPAPPHPPRQPHRPRHRVEADQGLGDAHRRLSGKLAGPGVPAPVQVLLGVDAEDEPAQTGARRALQSLPAERAKVVTCRRRAGPHPKVAKLCELYPHATHDCLAITDADVWVPPDLLAQTVPFLAQPGVGLVNCFYRQAGAASLPMRWLSLTINADFWTQVLQSNSLKPQDFALGAVMLTRRAELEALGGFASYLDYLADDYQLGHRITRLGRRIELSPVVVECRSEPLGWGGVWSHQLRQARTIRACQPLPYFFSILGNVTLWGLLWLLTSPGGVALTGVTLAQTIRILTALQNERRLDPERTGPSHAWMLPVKDLLQVSVWAGAFLGNTVLWRGERFRLRPGGKLEPLAVPSTGASASASSGTKRWRSA
ncbi:MAG: glycosyltransferase [Verrucomicrobia bacterium]|nr:glycosyltransferase [Verrucomicrobiota bacterium]